MAEKIPSSDDTEITTDAMASNSSTPIRVGSFKSHGRHSGDNDSSTPLSMDQNNSAMMASSQQQCLSSSLTQNSNNALNTANMSNSINIGGGGGGSGAVAGGSVSSSVTPPNSAGLRQTAGAFETKFMRRTSSLRILLPKLSSTDSISYSPVSTSSGLANWAVDSRDKYDGNQTDKSATDASKLNRKESYKAQRKNYRREKKRVASELLNSLQDPAVIVLADWLKVRGTLKSWTKLWCVLKPGLLLLYKSPKTKSSHWVGTILLTSCHVIERPSKKDGFCFKLFHPLEQSIWAPRGPDKETIGAVVQPLPTAYLIFRAPSQAAGKCWMDALELSLRCSGLLLRSNSSSGTAPHSAGAEGSISHETQWSEADYEKHFNDQDSLKRLIQKSQYLTVPDTDITKSSGSSDISQVTTPSQTPILQQLYNAMTNWEQVVTTGVPELRKLQKLRKYNESPNNANGKCSDISSLDFSPHKAVQKLKQDMSKELMLRSFLSMKQLSQTGTSSEAEDESVIMDHAIPIITVRAVSATPDLDGDSQNEAPAGVLSGLDTDSESDANDGPNGDNQIEQMEHYNEEPAETPYVPGVEGEFHTSAGEQVEELGEENKSLIWCLLKQVRPGMDLSKVVLPTFILEPRSFLDKLSDSYYHVDILSGAVTEDDPFTRMKLIVQWYLSGFYKKPKGLKKPYNPILGETFRCFWQHPSGSRTYYIAEQVSHHPPVSAFYVTNRQEGFSISCAILAKSKFYGNSTSAMLDGEATLTLLPRGECYKLTTPYAHCKGILMGTLSMELGGKVTIDCENTGYKTELEFKLKPFLGGADYTNVVAGKIKLVKETLATISGHWDGEMRIKDNKTGEESVLFAVSRDIIESRLVRYVVPLESQLPNESERLWQLVSDAIRRDDQVGATEEKSVLEEGQRSAAKERKAHFTEWQPQHFQQDTITCKWMYKYADLRPWDPRNDVKQYEIDYKVLTKTRHLAPMVRTSSIVNVDPSQVARFAENRQSSVKILKTTRIQNPGVDEEHQSDSSQSQDNGSPAKHMSSKSVHKLVKAVEQMNKALDEHTRQLMVINAKLERMQFAPSASQFESPMSSPGTSAQGIGQTIPQSVLIKTFAYVSAALIVSYFLKWLLN